MTQRMLPLTCVATLILLFCLVPAFGQNDIENPDHFSGVWYRLLLDSNGDFIEGGGHGLGWYYYPESNTWRMWFYNGSYDAARKGYLDYHVYTKAVDSTIPTYLVAYFGWTTAAWSQLGKDHPPLPDEMATTGQEALYMSSSKIYSVNSVVLGSVETERTYSIEDYNPEWTCITLVGRNAYVYRGAYHECVEDESNLGACCNHETGYCYQTYESDCLSPMVWLGAGTSCEDCTVTGAVATDYGDAPNSGYRTLLASNGARHAIVSGVYLGSLVDSESDGQPTTTATGDDVTKADEDGVTFTSTLQAGQRATIEVVASTLGYLNAWLDFDADGQFDDDDCIFTDTLLKEGTNELAFTVPSGAVSGYTYARFRFNTRGLLDSCGLADDGEVEDYRVLIVEGQSSQAISGATRLTWSQIPSGGANVFEGGSVSSSLHLHEAVADDWEPIVGQPVTGIHWWGLFNGWTQSYPPSDLPLAFHIGVWTDATAGSDAFDHPGSLIWETYCTSWTWAVAGTEQSGDATEQTCFLFSCQLSQDQWFQIDESRDDSASTVYWLSISALYDTDDGEPEHLWTWKLRTTASGAAATSVRTIVPASDSSSSWPPTVGAEWETGTSLSDSQFNPLDMAFQLTTFVPLGDE